MTSKQTVYVTIVIVVAAISFIGNGCTLGDVVPSRVPHEAAKDDGLPTKLPHNESAKAYKRWREDVKETDAEWRENLEDSAWFVGILEGATFQAWETFSPALAALGPFGILAAGVGGVFVKRYGDVSARDAAKGKEDSYNAGLEEGRRLAIEAQRVINTNRDQA